PEAEVLRPLADIEADRRLATARLAAVEQRQGVLDPEPAQVGRHGRGGDHLRLEESFGRAAGSLTFPERTLVLSPHAQIGRPGDDDAGLRAVETERLGG